MQSHEDHTALMNLARYFVRVSRKAEHARAERDRLVAEQDRLAEERGRLIGDYSGEPSRPETAWHHRYLRWDELANDMAAQIDRLSARLGITVDVVVGPLLLAP